VLGGLKSEISILSLLVVKHVLFLIGLLLLSSAARGQLHAPTWKLIDDQNMSSFDMLTTRKGLVAINFNGVRTLTKYDSGMLSGIYVPKATITSIIIRDQNYAYFTVNGDGIFEASNGWKDFSPLLKAPSSFLFSVIGNHILANVGVTLNYCNDGNNFQAAAGINPSDTILAADFLTSQIALAVSGKTLYESNDGGSNWNVVFNSNTKMNTIYCDRSNGIMYVGGTQTYRSSNFGKSWDTLTSVFFTLSGALVGARDCSGTFYIGPDAKTHGTDMYRSTDHGRLFVQAGPAMFSSIRLKKGVVLDRGSTFFYLDSSGLLGIVRDGIDSVVTDSVRDRLIIQADTGVVNSLCANASATPFAVHLFFDQCTGIVLDSLIQIASVPQFSAAFVSDTLQDTMNILFAYHAKTLSSDTAHYRLKFHSPTTGNIEQRFFDVIGSGIPGSPDLLLNPSEIDFATLRIDSTRKKSLSISNPGCDTLIIDTLFSTNPEIFSIDQKIYPIKIGAGKSFPLVITFSPHLAGDYLESVQIESSVANRFVALRGSAVAPTADIKQYSSAAENIYIFPNPANENLSLRSRSALPKKIILRDLLGRKVFEWQTGEELTFECNIQNIADGSYILDLGSSKFERIIILH